ncbi:ankyrin repeat domain-containing protein [Endozoicomonas sp. ONNA1]|uniref:ankyrin repeat domain-containing protein n=2 Tax=unclassified Endozoicomonas TaxID=2644528 RepID=UPI002147CB31|nr:ankyrin repeat domain-containing protein [Endozoicomonas sp. ONNA1]
MLPTGGASSNPLNLKGVDTTTSEKHNPVTASTKRIPFVQSETTPRTQSTVPSEGLCTTKRVKLKPARSILGHPYYGPENKKALLASNNSYNNVLMQQMMMELTELQVSSKEAQCRQHNLLDNSSPQVFINLIKQGDTKSVKECITNNPLALAVKNKEGNSVLHLAVLHGHDDLCRLLVSRAQHLLQATNNNGERPLHIAAKEEQNHFLRFFLDNCPSLSLLETELLATDKSGATPVHLAAQYGNKAGLMAMLDYESIRNVFVGNYFLIGLAIENGHTQCAEVIINSAKTAGTFFQPYNLLHYGVECGQLDCVKWLVQTYPDAFTPEEGDLNDLEPLTRLAIKRGHDEILKYLLEQPFVIKQLTKMGYASEFESKENGACAKLIRDAREKVKLPFCPVKNFDKTLFQQALQQEEDKIFNKNTKRDNLSDQPDNSFADRSLSSKYLPQVKALLSGLQEVGVYVHCIIEENLDKKGQFMAMGDTAASVGLIKALVALGAKTIYAQLSPPDFSDFITRQKFNHKEQIRYIKKQRIALSMLAYLLPGIKLKPGTQEIYIKDTRVIISSCSLRRENKINAAVTLSFFRPEMLYWQLGYIQESYITLKPYRFFSEHETMYSDTKASVKMNDKNNEYPQWSQPCNFSRSTFIDKSPTTSIYDKDAMPDCNIIPLHLPANSIIPSDDLQPQGTEISTESVDSHQATLISAIDELCDLSTNGKIQTAVVYGLHTVPRQYKKTILTNWLSAIKMNQDQLADALPVVVTTTVSAFRDKDREGDEYMDESGTSSLKEIASTTGFTLIDFRDQQDWASLRATVKSQWLLCLMPSLPRQSFNKLVQSSRFPVLSEGANLTSTLLQNGQAHLSLLPYGNTPVAQDMGVPLEALKALAFSCKLQMERKGAENEVLKTLSNFVRKGRYAEALSYIDKIRTEGFENGALSFVWADPQPSPLHLRPVTIMSLLHKAEKLGGIEKKALLAALDPSDQALTDYINSCLDKNSITNHHFRLQQMHVNKPFNNKVLAALLQFGRYKKLLP